VSSVAAFMTSPATVTITQAGQRVLVLGQATLGTTSILGAANLNLWIGHRPSGSGAVPTTVGSGLSGLTMLAIHTMANNITGVIENLPVGTHEVGVVGLAIGSAWDITPDGSITAIVLQ